MGLYNRVKFNTTTTGTGAITVGTARSGFLTPAQAGMVNGELFPYSIEDGANWETGVGLYTTSGATFTRTVRQSSNSNNPIDLSGAAIVGLTPLKEDVGWQKLIDESGASFAAWASGGGTWSSNGTVIQQTDTAATYRTAYFATKQPVCPAFIWQADIKALSAGANATHVIALVIGYSGATNSAGALCDLRVEAGTRKIFWQRAFTNTIQQQNYSWSDDTFYTMRIVSSGGLLSCYINNALIGTVGQYPNNAAPADYVGLATYGCGAHFKNLKGWALPLPFYPF